MSDEIRVEDWHRVVKSLDRIAKSLDILILYLMGQNKTPKAPKKSPSKKT